MPSARITNVIREKYVYFPCQLRVFCEGSRNQAWPSRTQHVILRMKQFRYSFHHRLDPRWVRLGPQAIFDHRRQKRVTRLRTKSIVADVPIHPKLLPKVIDLRQLFEWKHALGSKQRRQILRQENVQIHIKPTIAIDRQIAEEIESLDGIAEGMESVSMFGRLFTEDSIGDALSNRDIATHLRDMGMMTRGPTAFDRRDRSAFLQRLDEVIQAIRQGKGVRPID